MILDMFTRISSTRTQARCVIHCLACIRIATPGIPEHSALQEIRGLSVISPIGCQSSLGTIERRQPSPDCRFEDGCILWNQSLVIPSNYKNHLPVEIWSLNVCPLRSENGRLSAWQCLKIRGKPWEASGMQDAVESCVSLQDGSA